MATSLYIVAFFASATGTVSSAVGAVPNEMVAVLAIIPGIVALALGMFKPDMRSQWWSKKYGKLDDLMHAMEYEKMNETAASKTLTQFLAAH